MTELISNNNDNYDTTINIIGGLRDIGVVYKAIESYFAEEDSVEELITSRNELNLRTERSQKRILKAIDVAFLDFFNQDHIDIFSNIFIRDEHLPERELALLWQFSLLNTLFRDISLNVFVKHYFSGRTGISKDDITGYLKEFLSRNKHLDLKWSESTVQTISTKYLNLMTKFNFLEGARIKSFRHIKVSDESLVLFLYFAQLHDVKNKNILSNKLLPLSFVPSEDILERLKKVSMKGFFNMNFNGVELNIELIQSYKGICDALYNRS